MAKREIKGQTTVEYVLTMLALFAVFTGMYRFSSWYLLGQFKEGARIVLTAYGF